MAVPPDLMFNDHLVGSREGVSRAGLLVLTLHVNSTKIPQRP